VVVVANAYRRLWDRVRAELLALMPYLLHHGSVFPGPNALREKPHVVDGRVEALCVVEELLQFQVRDELAGLPSWMARKYLATSLALGIFV